MDIAILEPHQLLNDFLHTTLKMAGHTPFSYAETLPTPIDLLIFESDQVQIEEIEIILATRPELPVIVLTSHAPTLQMALMQYVRVWIVEKPFHMADLRRIIEATQSLPLPL